MVEITTPRTPEQSAIDETAGYIDEVQNALRAELKRGRKPTLDATWEARIEQESGKAVEFTDTARILCVLPKHRPEFSKLLIDVFHLFVIEGIRAERLPETLNNTNKAVDDLLLWAELFLYNLLNIKVEFPQEKDSVRLAAYHQTDFIKKFVHNDTFLAKELGISETDAHESFPRGMRVYFAVGNISDPVAALRRVKEHLETKLTDANLATELGISEEDAHESFPRGIRVRFAVRNISDPVAGLAEAVNGGSHPYSDFSLDEKVKTACKLFLQRRVTSNN